MSKFAAIDVAVRLQMADDGATIDYNLVLRAQVGHAYDDASMRTFLLNVANRLRLDQPPWDFAWNSLNVTDCLNSKLPMLISLIESQTKSSPKP